MQSLSNTGLHKRLPETERDIDCASLPKTTCIRPLCRIRMDQLGIRDQAMREYLRPVHNRCTFAGWARTISCSDVYHMPDDPYSVEIAAVDSLLPGEVAVIGTQKSVRNAPWGELLSTAARARGARGAVVDGLVRDVRKIEELGFPVFATGIKPVDSIGRGIVTAYNVPVECGEVLVISGRLCLCGFRWRRRRAARPWKKSSRSHRQSPAREQLSRAS